MLWLILEFAGLLTVRCYERASVSFTDTHTTDTWQAAALLDSRPRQQQHSKGVALSLV